MCVLVLQHIACEPPGVYEDVLRERGADIHRVELDENEPLPHWRGFDAIVAMGGPMSVNEHYGDSALYNSSSVAAASNKCPPGSLLRSAPE